MGLTKQNKEIKVKGIAFCSAQQVVNVGFAKNVDQVYRNLHNIDPYYHDWVYVNPQQQRSRRLLVNGTVYNSVAECLSKLNMGRSNLYYKLADQKNKNFYMLE